ncbi:hypothetical protein B0G57_104206 [Trinickia symbiotica]|uniref:hypothetical protein n=1 Tax=Trinickia symbiotica TaxID=863227 RepID=UPI00037769E6|nr:hypothetical protein [Trinickia symbiotica]PPK45804.1 hypothetical protein B0G57_104206 [Trinickia symbiotica]
MQLAMLALHAHGYRTLTSRSGHHQTAIQTLSKTVGLSAEGVIVLDALRKQRNLSDYSGDLVSDSAVRACIESATELLSDVKQWLVWWWTIGITLIVFILIFKQIRAKNVNKNRSSRNCKHRGARNCHKICCKAFH